MSFLDNIKKKGSETALSPTPTPTPKVNPLAAKNPPLLKKTETIIQGQPEAAKEVPATTPPAPKKDLSSLLKKKTEEKVEPVQETTPVEPVEDAQVTDIVTDMKQEEKDSEVKEVKAPENKAEVTPKKGNKKPAAKKDTKTSQEDDSIMIDAASIPTTQISFAEAMKSISSPFVDSEWESYKEELQNDIDNIMIDDDMNPATLKSTIGKLSRLRNKVWNNYQSMRGQYESLASKEPEGLIERIKKINLAGNNDLERKKAGVEACMNFIDKTGNVINLYELLDETRSRYYFLKSVMDSIEYKRNVLVTMNGALKIEQSLTSES